MASVTGVALVCLVALCVLGQAWGSVGAVDGVFSKADRKGLADIVSEQQRKDGSFGSLEDTYEAVSALLALRSEVKHKDDLCKYAAAELAAAKTSESVFYSVSIAELLNCGQAISKATAVFLNDAVAATDLHTNYFAIAAAYALNLGKHLGGDFDRTLLKAAVKRFADLAGAEGRFTRTAGGQESSYNSALAFQATAFAAALTEIEKEAIAEIADEVNNLVEAEALADRDDEFAFEDETGVESALETTAEVIEGIDALQRLTGKPLGIKPEHVVGLAQFFVSLDDDVSDPEAVNALATALNLLAASSVHKPVSLTVVSETLSLGSKDQLRVSVSDIFGAALGKPKVTIVRARSRTEESSIANQAMNADGETDFVYEFLASKPEQGIYIVEFRVTPGAESAVRYVRIISVANVADVSLAVSDSKTADDPSADVRKFSLETGKKLSEVVKASANSHIHLFFRLKNAAARNVAAQQVAVRLVNQKTKEEEVFDGTQTTKGYRVHIDVAAAASELNHASGLYKAELLVGDADISNSLQWHFADLQIAFPPHNATDEDEAALKPKKEIHHQFRPPASRGSDPLSRLFTLLVLSPWAVLVVGLLVLGANLRRFPFSGLEPINAPAFLASIAAIFFLLYVYWLRLNMFQALYYLAILAAPAVFFGSRALRHLHNTSAKQKKE